MSDSALVEFAAAKLKPLLNDIVFLGGSVLGLLITDSGSGPLRSTIDIDVVAEITSYGEYTEFSEGLRSLGFSEDTREAAPLCRWTHGDLTLDVMPTEPAVLGFSNRWYRTVLENFSFTTLPSGLTIRLITAPLFLATKMEAFRSRGQGDFYASHDLEDFVAVVEGREELLQELERAPADVNAYLRVATRDLLAERRFREALPGYLQADSSSQARFPILLRRLEELAAGEPH